MTQYHFVGMDVAKDKFDVALKTNNSNQHECFSNDITGYRSFLKWVNKHTNQPWVCMEATGHYSELIADFLFSQEMRVSVVNPLQIKSFGRAKLSRNKTDKADAQLIADYCEKMQPRTFIARSKMHKELKDLTNLLDMLKAQHTQLNNLFRCAQSKPAKMIIERLIKELAKETAKIEERIAQNIKNDQSLKDDLALITSIPGIGNLTAYKVLSHIPDMSCFPNAKKFAAYIGVSPRQHQSGKFKGRTTISRLGDARLRKIFYMAGMVATRFNKLLQPFVRRLQENGKAPKAIICAVMRKLAHLVYGVLKNRKPFDVEYG